jgi:nitroreductase
METLKALALRKSVRSYKNQPVEQQKLDGILKAGNHAPNAGPFLITVIQNPDYLREINDAALTGMKNSGNEFLMQRAALPGYQPLYGAPYLILLSAPAEGYGMANTSCAATNMTIAAADLGLGSCYVITPTLALDGKNTLSRKLNLPEGFVPMCGVLLGYAGDEGFPAERPAADNITYIS